MLFFDSTFGAAQMSTFFTSRNVFLAAVLLRVALFSYGLFQDAFSPMKYTDIDYYVFTDAARFVSQGMSPYERDTYRYTPLLAWLLLPTTGHAWLFSFGKALFAVGDLIAGALIAKVLRSSGMPDEQCLKFASIWLLNPMVAAISTRGSSEGLLGVMVIALLWAVTQKKVILAGILLGLSVHFKIYPFIYAPSVVWWLDDERMGRAEAALPHDGATLGLKMVRFLSPDRIKLAISSLATFAALNALMFSMLVPCTLALPVLLTDKMQIWMAIRSAYLPSPRHAHRSQTQFLHLQHSALLEFVSVRQINAAIRIPRILSPVVSFCGRHPTRARQSRPRLYHARPDLCLCNL